MVFLSVKGLFLKTKNTFNSLVFASFLLLILALVFAPFLLLVFELERFFISSFSFLILALVFETIRFSTCFFLLIIFLFF